MHSSTFDYLKPTDGQLDDMTAVRKAFAEFIAVVEYRVPPGLDRSYAIRQLREAAMWCNVAITRMDDGTPRA